MKTALVTGGTGFIGHHLANELNARGYKVVVVDKALNNCKYLHPNINFMLTDIRKVEFCKSYDVVYHLAALRSVPENDFVYPEEYISTNVWGTYYITKCFPSSRVVFVSSVEAADSQSIYGITKKSAEHFVNLHKNSISIRVTSVFGERQLEEERIIPTFLFALKHNKKAVIHGDGSLTRDYVYVGDLVNELIRLGESRIKGQTETGYGTPIRNIDMYNMLARTAKIKPNCKFGPARKGDSKRTGSKFKIKEPKYGLMEGIRRTVRWYLEEEQTNGLRQL